LNVVPRLRNAVPQLPDLPPVSAAPLSVVLLAQQAADHVETTLRSWLEWLSTREGEWELILVDDASSDGTAEKARGVNHPRLQVLTHDKPEGEGRALRTGLKACLHPLIAYAPCEPGYRPEHVQKLFDQPLLEQLNPDPSVPAREIDHVHLLSGYRAGVPMPLVPRMLGWLWRTLCWLVFNYPPVKLPGWLGVRRHLAWFGLRFVFALRYHDPLCPVRLFRREILHRMPLQSRTAFVHVEILAKANFLGKIVGAEQVPLDVVPPNYRGDAGALWRDMQRLMNAPDFGPPVVEEGSILSQTTRENPAPAP
jgi:glycosyltransferase involved in cell wall biosynthesis